MTTIKINHMKFGPKGRNWNFELMVDGLPKWKRKLIPKWYPMDEPGKGFVIYWFKKKFQFSWAGMY